MLKSRLSQKTYCFSADELQSRLRALTITLVQKQSSLESLTAEKNALVSKMNHLQVKTVSRNIRMLTFAPIKTIIQFESYRNLCEIVIFLDYLCVPSGARVLMAMNGISFSEKVRWGFRYFASVKDQHEWYRWWWVPRRSLFIENK